jgi:hypothetical protein
MPALPTVLKLCNTDQTWGLCVTAFTFQHGPDIEEEEEREGEGEEKNSKKKKKKGLVTL